MVPDGWKKTSFEEHIDLLSGQAFKSAQYTKEPKDIRLLRGDNIEPSSLRWKDAKRWPIDDIETYKKYELKEGDLVIAMDRTWVSAGLKVAEVKSHDVPCLLVQRVARVRARKTILQCLLIQYFTSHHFHQYVMSVQTETAVPHISAKQIKDFPLTLPTLPEQRKIAKILQTWDRAIATTEKLIDASKQQKKALMQQLLTGKKRFAGFEGEWEEVKLSTLCDIRRGASPRPIADRKWFAEHGRGWIRIADVTAQKGQHLLFTKQHLSELGINNSVCVDPGDLIMSICGTIGVPKFIGIKACIHDGFVVFRKPHKRLCLNFLYHYLLFIANRLTADGQPGTQKNLNTGIVGNIKYPSISCTEQLKIAETLTSADFEIDRLTIRLAHLKQEKKALMQQLLTGKRRVKIDD